MDKISSYPSGLLEADARAESHWAPRVHSPERPGEWRLLKSPWAQVTGPNCTLTGQAQVIGTIPYVWAGHMTQCCRLETISKLHRFPKIKLRRFHKMKLRHFLNVR